MDKSEHSYSLRVKNGAGWRRFNRIRLLISVGHEYHEGQKLEAIVDWINRNPSIEEVHISVNDLLQRHNFIAAGVSEQEAISIALAEGGLWIARNGEVLSKIHAKKQMTRWKDWFGTPDFLAALSALLAYKEQDSLFQETLKIDSCALAARKDQRGEGIPTHFIEQSQSYIEEEMAVFAIQSARLPAAEVYPGSNLQAADYLSSINVQQLPLPIRSLASRYFTRVDFARKKEHVFPPQSVVA